MNHRSAILMCVGLILALASIVEAKDWRGITPLRSTRADVERTLGKPSTKEADRGCGPDRGCSVYYVDGDEVYIAIAGPEVEEPDDDQVDISRDTVLLIRVTPKSPSTLVDLGINEINFRKFNPTINITNGYEGYLNEIEGLVVRTRKGLVDELVFFADSLDIHLFPGFYREPRSLVAIYDRESGNDAEYQVRIAADIPPVTGKHSPPIPDPVLQGDCVLDAHVCDPAIWQERLESLAMALKSEPSSTAYVVIYRNGNEDFERAQELAEQIRHQLVDIRESKADRVLVIDGGRSTSLWYELMLVPEGVEPPKPDDSAGNKENQQGLIVPASKMVICGEPDFGVPKQCLSNPANPDQCDIDAPKARLDNLAHDLKQDLTAQGYIIVYSNRSSDPGDERLLANWLISYLAAIHGIGAERLVVIYGGEGPIPNYELHTVAAGATPPTPRIFDEKELK